MKQEKFLFSNCALLNDKLFFIETQSGLLGTMNLESGDIAYCSVMEGYVLRSGDIVDFISSYQGKVYALEMSGKNLIIFDLEKLRCQYVALNCNYHAWGNFVAFERYKSDYYIFPRFEDNIFVFNIENNKITDIRDYFWGINRLRCCCRVGDKVWILPQKEDTIGVYDLSEKRMEIYRFKETIQDAEDAIFANGNIYILNRYGRIYRWDIENKNMQIITMLETAHIETESMYRIIYAGDKLIVLPSYGKDIKILNLLTNEIEIYHDYPDDFFFQEIRWSKYYGSCEDENYYYFALRSGNHLLKVCKENGEMVWIKPNIPLIEVKMRTAFAMGKLIYNENDGDVISLSKIALADGIIDNISSIGEEIYKEAKKSYES